MTPAKVLRIAVVETRHAAIMTGYWIRPYDQHLDARRWRWQRRGCPTPAERQQIGQVFMDMFPGHRAHCPARVGKNCTCLSNPPPL